MGKTGRVVRHRALRLGLAATRSRTLTPIVRRLRLTATRRRTLTLIGCVLALALPVFAGAATLVGRRVDIDAGRSTWIVPHRIDLAPGAEADAAAPGAEENAAAPGGEEDAAAPGGESDVPPSRLRIGALGVDTPLENLRMDGAGVLASPAVYGEAGWFSGGTVPGDAGPAVLAGHVDSKTGPAVFYRLHELKPGDTVEVQRGDGWLTFRVTASEHYPKAQFPSAKVYGPTPVPELRLITCGGTFDQSRHSYRDNLVVYAVLE